MTLLQWLVVAVTWFALGVRFARVGEDRFLVILGRVSAEFLSPERFRAMLARVEAETDAADRRREWWRFW